MTWSEVGLILLSIAVFAGLFVMVSQDQKLQPTDTTQEETERDPFRQIEEDFAAICYGSGFRPVSSASGDTLVKSMDLLNSVSIHKANLLLTRSLARNGFNHIVTFAAQDRGLSFLCHTPQGQPVRFELNSTTR
ncbi:MAG: hypothetical protein K8R76_05150 [Candidatus Aegiribacteria sp.]|nr:hypothetical protein [Candidatus Aegiribacteria sp.]